MDEFERRLRRAREASKATLTQTSAQSSEDVDFYEWKPMPYQGEWFESEAQIKLILAGNQVGKTLCLIIRVLILGLGILPVSLGGKRGAQPVPESRKGIQILLAGESAKAVKKTFVTKLEHFLKPEWVVKTKAGKEGFVEEYKLITGATITIWSYAQHASTWEGPQWNFAGFDEPPKKSHFAATQRGTMKRQGEIWVTATPLKEEWMQDDLIEPAQDPTSDLYEQADYFRVDMHANCKEHNNGYIPHDRIMAYLATLSPDERAAREHGIFMARTGLELMYVREDTHVVPDWDVTADIPIVEVIDPSLKRGIWCGWFAFKPDNTVDWFQATVIPHGPLSLMCGGIHRMRAQLPSKPVIEICDQRGLKFNSDSEAQKNWMQSFAENGLRYTKSLDVPMPKLHDWLAVPHGENTRPKLALTRRVASMREGPLWACARFRWNPLDSHKKLYGQKGKDWIDLMRYLSGHPGLSYARLAPLQGRERQPGAVRAYVQQRPRPNDLPTSPGTRLQIGSKRMNRLRRQGWRL